MCFCEGVNGTHRTTLFHTPSSRHNNYCTAHDFVTNKHPCNMAQQVPYLCSLIIIIPLFSLVKVTLCVLYNYRD